MGRYYWGDIEGKFWFGVQASNDADYFGSKGFYEYNMYWQCCGEDCDYDTTGGEGTCPHCGEEDSMASGLNDPLRYCYETYDLDTVNDKLNELEQQIQSLFTNKHALNFWLRNIQYKLRPRRSERLNKYDSKKCSIDTTIYKALIGKYLTNDDVESESEFYTLVARYHLGLKIWDCLQVQGSCNFWAE